ncbi:MAG: glycosyltransferase [Flavobacteriales bacterium]|nr:glycosyltransferase [Flavobacteriales bacterium]
MEKTVEIWIWNFSIIELILLGLVVVSFIVQVYYNLKYFLSATKGKKVEGEIPDGVSVIVCARNEEANLMELIPVIMEQEFRKFQLIVVNDSSWDDTADILKALQVSYPEMHVIEINEDKQMMQGKKFALTLGIKAAMYDVVLLTDADCRPTSSHWITEMTKGIGERKEIGLGFSGYKKYPGYLNKLIRFDAFITGLNYLGFAKTGRPYMGVGRNLCYTKTAFFRIGGFRTHYKLASGDDDLFVKEASTARNTQNVFHYEAQTISEPHKTWSKWSFQKKRHFTTAPLYKSSVKFSLMLWPSTYFVLWMAAIALSIIYPNPMLWGVLGGVVFLRYLIQFIVLNVSCNKLKISKDILWLFPLLEKHLFLVHSMLYLHNLVRKPQKWN